jgi:hypothetical protein
MRGAGQTAAALIACVRFPPLHIMKRPRSAFDPLQTVKRVSILLLMSNRIFA